MDVNPLRGGGYYKIEGVQQSKDLHYDVYLLTPEILNNEHIKVFHDFKQRYPTKKKKADIKKTTLLHSNPATVRPYFEDIKESINGYARIVYYKF